jgi:monoamine oxidase
MPKTLNHKKNIIIIGAGLSGLYAATLLQAKFNVTILEARNRIGGRVLTKNGHDLGPSWVWPHQENIIKLIHEHKLELFPQYTKGEALYDAPDGVRRFNAPSSVPSLRVEGGLQKLLKALVSNLTSDIIYLNHEVKHISASSDRLCVETAEHIFDADYIISTLSPRLACENILYHPPLDDEVMNTMLQIPTWMGHTAKCVIEFKDAFWKKEGLSGFVFSHVGPLGEIHDASTKEKPALFGFLQHRASTKELNKKVIEQMERLFPNKSRFITNIYLTDWREQKFSSSRHDHQGISHHPEYGLTLSHFDNRMFFIGTETAYDNGGYLEGAINSAITIAKRLADD